MDNKRALPHYYRRLTVLSDKACSYCKYAKTINDSLHCTVFDACVNPDYSCIKQEKRDNANQK